MDAPSNKSKFIDRVEQAAKVMRIPVSDLLIHLDRMGISQDDEDAVALLEAETTREGDARAQMVDGRSCVAGETVPQLVKIARFSAGFAILKGKAKTEEKNSVDVIVSALRPVKQWSNRELLEKYGPEASSEIVEELRARSKDRNFIIFIEGDGVDVENTEKTLRLASRQELPTVYQLPDQRAVRLHKVGEFPMFWVEECPIHPNCLLVEGYCEHCEANWSGVPNANRVMIRVAYDMGLVNKNPTKIECAKLVKDLNFVIDLQHIPSFAVRFKEWEEEKRLPILKKRLSRPAGGSDPFFVHKTY